MRLLRILTKLAISLYIALVNLVFCYAFYFVLLIILFLVLPLKYKTYIENFLAHVMHKDIAHLSDINLIFLILPVILLGIYFLYCISPIQIAKMRRQMGYVEPSDYELRRLTRLMNETGIGRTFKLYLSADTDVNANTFGLNSIGVTSAMINSASDDEIKGVICHEYGHIAHNDYSYRTGLYSFELFGQRSIYGVFYTLDKIFCTLLYIPRVLLPIIDTLVNIILAIWWFLFKVLMVLIYGLSTILMANLNKYSEYRCDRYAVYYGHGEGLLLFLRRIKYIEDALEKPSLFERLNNEHPSTGNRIKRLESLLGYR